MLNKQEIKNITEKMDLNEYNYTHRDKDFIYFSKRCNDYKSQNYGLYKNIKCKDKDILNGNIEYLCKYDMSL